MSITVSIYYGHDTVEYIETISQMRIDILKEYPYLYKGDNNYEKDYMKYYSDDNLGMIAIARVDGEIAGVSTGIPLISNSLIVSDAAKLFNIQKIDITNYYYYGEVLVHQKFRGSGITSKLYSAQNSAIVSLGFTHTCILTVVREDNHPLKPLNYKSPDKMWEHLGFFRQKMTTEYSWPTIQSDLTVIDINNTLEFWVNELIPNKL